MNREEKKDLFSSLKNRAKQIVDQTQDMENVYIGIVELLDTNIPYYNWTGFYMVEEGKLKLGHFIGAPTDHTYIEMGQGICGQAADKKETFVVDDVTKEGNYLACSFETASEIVVPIMKGSEVLGEIDIDSHELAAFDELDKELLEAIAEMIANRL